MGLDWYEAIACGTLNLKHIHGTDHQDIAVGTFRICDHSEIFDGLAGTRRLNAERILFKSPEVTKGLTEDECYELAYYHIPHNFTYYLELADKMPSLERDYISGKGDQDEYDNCLAGIEEMMEERHPGITRRRKDPSYHNLAAEVAQEYKVHTGKNIHTLAERAKRYNDKLREKYGQADVMFFKDYWQKTKLTSDANGYLTYISMGFPKYAAMLGHQVDLTIPEEIRKRHTYIVGATGSGKSELIKIMAYGDIAKRESAVVMIDPHGDLVEQVSRLVSFGDPFYSDELIYVDPFLHEGHSPVINPLECEGASSSEREVIADQLVGAFEELLKGDGGSSLSLNMRTLLKPCLLVLLDEGNTSFNDLQAFLNDERNEHWLNLAQSSPRRSVRTFFENEFSNSTFAQTKESLRNKLQSLFNSSAFFDLINGKSTIDLKQAIDDKKIILFNLSKGKIGTEASEALGRFIIASIKGIVLRRADKSEEQRVPIHLYIDECQNYIGPSIHTILTETRKYKLHMTMAQQVSGDGMSHDLKQIVFNNVQVNFAGRTKKDSNIPQLIGVGIEDLQNLDVGQFYCRIGSNSTMKLQVYTDLCSGENNITDQQWADLCKDQKRYYISANQEDDISPQSDAAKPAGSYTPDLV